MPADAERPVLPAPIRRPAIAVAAVGFVLTAALCVRYAGDTRPDRLDVAVRDSATLDWLVQRPALALEIVHVGAPLAVAATTILLAAVCLAFGHRWPAVLVAAGVGSAGTTAILLEPVVGRTYDGVLTFPSGHTSGITAVALVTALLLIPAAGRRWRAVTVLAGVCVAGVAAVMGAALVTLGAHHATDVVGGFALAVTVVLGVAFLVDAMQARAACRDRDPAA